MSFSAQRLTCFALISSLEGDMRLMLQSALGQATPSEAIPAEQVEVAQERRGRDRLKPATTLAGLLDYLDTGHLVELLNAHKASLPSTAQTAVETLVKYNSKVLPLRNRVAHSRPMEIDDTAIMLDVASELVSSDPESWPELTDTVSLLQTDPSHVLGLTISLPMDDIRGPQHNLPIPDFDETGFMGRKRELHTVKKRLLGSYPVVAVLGDGGVGKTAIALKAAYDILNQPDCPFDVIVWVTAKATILTPHEIRRVSGAIETSLGLFAAAVEELSSEPADPIGELYAYMEEFKVFLILDNLETVLDATLRSFLQDIPLGSKVLLTSRIATGVENPVPLEPLSEEESTSLLRALSRARRVGILESMDANRIAYFVQRMAGHPAYIKWFVSGVQAGSRPEDLVANNELLLDFCMSNVYQFLNPEARTVLACMQVLPGQRNQAELAHLTNFTAKEIQSALLNLLNTNFVSMAHPSDESFDTSYRLSDFAKQYLDKHHPVDSQTRSQLTAGGEELRQWGSLFSEEVAKNPLSPEIAYIRGAGDVGIARLLRRAIGCFADDPDAALRDCVDAQSLAPGFYEPWRVQAYIYARMGEHDAAFTAYRDALERAPESPILAYHFGDFLLNVRDEPRAALPYFQSTARAMSDSQEALGQIAWSHYRLGDSRAAIATAGQVALLARARKEDVTSALSIVGRSCARGLWDASARDFESAVEGLDMTVEILEQHDDDAILGEVGDWLIAVAHVADGLVTDALRNETGSRTPYAATRASTLAKQLRQRAQDATGSVRYLGQVVGLHRQEGFGFLTPTQSFFHIRDCVDRSQWDWIVEGDFCAFTQGRNNKGPRAQLVRHLQW